MKFTKRALLFSALSFVFSKYWESRNSQKNEAQVNNSHDPHTDQSLVDIVFDRFASKAKKKWSEAVLRADKVVNNKA